AARGGNGVADAGGARRASRGDRTARSGRRRGRLPPRAGEVAERRSVVPRLLADQRRGGDRPVGAPRRPRWLVAGRHAAVAGGGGVIIGSQSARHSCRPSWPLARLRLRPGRTSAASSHSAQATTSTTVQFAIRNSQAASAAAAAA